MQKDTNVTTKKWSVLNILVSFYCIGSLCQKKTDQFQNVRNIYYVLQKARNAVSDNLKSLPAPPRDLCSGGSLDRMATNGYYLFSKFNRFGVCHLCELKVHMQVKPRKPFTVSKPFVRFSSSV